MSGRSAEGGGAGSLTIDIMLSKSVGFLNSRSVVSISHITIPRLNRSLRRSSAPVRHCSGDRYAILPFTVPALVSCSRSAAFATPKSTTLTWPS